MNERSIIMQGPGVRAILEGRKTQTRRVCKVPSITPDNADTMRSIALACPYGQPGDLLWVRETYNPGLEPNEDRRDGYRGCVYKADDITAVYAGGWTPSIHMLRRHSRLTLRITDVRIQRVREITDGDVAAEGVEWASTRIGNDHGSPARDAFARLWDSINAKRSYSWESNPWVWAISFERVKVKS